MARFSSSRASQTAGCSKAEKARIAKKLREAAAKANGRPPFGILGAKWKPLIERGRLFSSPGS